MTTVVQQRVPVPGSGGCSCCAPASECGQDCVRAGKCVCPTSESGAEWILRMDEIEAECLLPSQQRPGREAEFEALFYAAGRNWSRPTATRVELELDRCYEGWARELAEREKACCSFFTFAFGAGSGGTLRLEVSVPASHTVVVDALSERAAAIAEASQ